MTENALSEHVTENALSLPVTGSAWSEHLTAGLLGTGRRPVPELAGAPRDAGGDVGDQAGRLLDQAALLTLRRRAGRLPGSAEPIAPAPAETAALLSAAAVRRLERLLAGEHVRVLPEWLAAVSEGGLRVPARLLPDLLERGRGDRPLRPYIARTTGRRGLWLALQNPDWAYLATEDAPAAPGADTDLWETGTRGQRVAQLTRLRKTDPAAARNALAGTWAKEPAADRAAFLGTFADGLSPADEEFLEQALDDRAKDVRGVAADLLVRLPGSDYGRRMADRARQCLRAERSPVRHRYQMWIIVEAPAGHDEGMERDGIPFHAPGSFVPSGPTGDPGGTRAGWLREIVARAPLATWTELFGATPLELVCLPITGRYAIDVHLGWARAALRQRDADWARAVLKVRVLVNEVEVLADLVGVLPEGEREQAAADLLRWADRQVDLLRMLERMPGPWAGELAAAFLTTLAEALKPTAATGGHDTRFVVQLCGLADDRLAPAAAPQLDALALAHPESGPLIELRETLHFRHEMLQELL